MALPDLDTQLLNSPADFEESVFGEDEILAWARHDQGGGLPFPAAHPFAGWLDRNWNEFADPEQDSQTNLDVLYGALDEWTGGRVVRPTDSLKASYAAAEAAHAALYADVDNPAVEDNGWRRGPHPIRLADFFAELAGTGTLVWLKD